MSKPLCKALGNGVKERVDKENPHRARNEEGAWFVKMTKTLVSFCTKKAFKSGTVP